MTIKELRTFGVAVRKNDGEYRVSYIGYSERYAYYTDDKQDAIDTGKHMAENRPADLKADLRIGREM